MDKEYSDILITEWVKSNLDFDQFFNELELIQKRQFVDELKTIFDHKRKFISGATWLLLIGWINFVMLFIFSKQFDPVVTLCFTVALLGQLLWLKEKKSMIIWKNLYNRSKTLWNII